MQRLPLKSLLMLMLPILLIIPLSTLLRDPTSELQDQLTSLSTWRSADGTQELSLAQSSSFKTYSAEFSRRGKATWRPYFRLVDANSLRMAGDGVAKPGIMAHIRVNGDEMILEPAIRPSDAKMTNTKWIRVRMVGEYDE
jgi:hypothetical protein